MGGVDFQGSGTGHPRSLKYFIVPATNDQNVGTWIKDGCLERYESNVSGKLNLPEGALQCFGLSTRCTGYTLLALTMKRSAATFLLLYICGC